MRHIRDDFLEIFHDLGVVWGTAWAAFIAWLTIRYRPLFLPKQKGQLSLRAYIAWSLLICLALYMCINFILRTFCLNIIFLILHRQDMIAGDVRFTQKPMDYLTGVMENH